MAFNGTGRLIRDEHGVVVEVWRGPAVESRHRVAVAVASSGGLTWRSGDTTMVVFARSAVKPLQALPLVEAGVLDRFGMGDEELALACASHSGEARHVAVARRMLTAIGLKEEDLACGPQRPFHEGSARALRAEGRDPGRIHNNCSGKHAGMLALARAHGWEPAGYHELAHPVQQRMLDEVSRWSGQPRQSIGAGVDGCGVVTFALPLQALALAFARFATAEDGGARRVLSAMAAYPELVGGTDRLCTRLIQATSGRVIAKVGAEGVYCACAPASGMGIALKVVDGARRAAEPALLEVLRSLDLISAGEQAELAGYATPAILNTRRERVGEVVARVALEPAHG